MSRNPLLLIHENVVPNINTLTRKINKIFKLLLYSFTLILVLILSITYYIYCISFDEKQVDILTNQILSANELPIKFIDSYNLIKPISDTKHSFIVALFNNGTKKNNCPCLDLSRLMVIKMNRKSNIVNNGYFLSLKLENKVTQIQCLNYLTRKWDFLYKNIGIENASKFYFDKKLDSLNKKEYLTLGLMLDNPMLYNPKRERMKKKLNNRLEEILRDKN